MKLTVPALAPLLPFLTGCIVSVTEGDLANDEVDGSSTSNAEFDTESSTSESSSSDTSSDTTQTSSSSSSDTSSDTTQTSSETGTDTVADTSTDTSTDTGTDTSTDTSTDTGTETGEAIEFPPDGYCGMSPGPVDPWLTLDQYGQALVPGELVDLECGGQGFWMFRIHVDMGGFAPLTKLVPLEATMDVEGYNIGPNGHFAVKNMFNWFLGCCDDPEDYDAYNGYCYYGNWLTFFPPDAIADMSVLDGLTATITVTATTPEGVVEEQVDVTIWAVPSPSWDLCTYEYYDALPPLQIALPIPQG